MRKANGRSGGARRGRQPHPSAQLLDNSVVHPQLLLLRFRLPDGKTANRLILGDETAAELLRRLRARLALRRP
jgi:hypothetical protein